MISGASYILVVGLSPALVDPFCRFGNKRLEPLG
jgi:hypothetical protein